MIEEASDGADLVSMTADIVAAYVASNATSRTDLTVMIGMVYAALSGLGAPVAAVAKVLEPAVPVRKSVSSEAITCLECGKQFQSIKRHLGTSHSLTPDAYRDKWALPASYPMVASAYSSRRSQMAKSSGLGRKPAPSKPTKKSAKK